MSILAVIPVRMGSSRFPGKPLKKINGTPMVQRVINNCEKSKLVKKVVTATCDKEIFKFVSSLKKDVVMTSKKHNRASDRVCEAVKKLEKNKNKKYKIVVMIQGDEPMVTGKMIDNALKPMLSDKSINVINLVSPIRSKDELLDINTIKVTYDKKMNAVYFSRSVIPFFKKFIKNFFFKQVCVIPFRRDFLFKYSSLKETKLEKVESIDMLRIVENNLKVKLVKVSQYTHAVDNLKDLKLVERLI
ncbi:MAG: 3-deoxy-manno-octulosonate cytidylyltransferase [Candidatus Pelagibacter sp.]